MLVVVGVIIAFIVVTYPFLATTEKPKRAATSSLDNILTDADTHNLGIGGISKEVEQLQGDVAAIKKMITDNGTGKQNVAAPAHDETDALAKRLAALEADLRNRPANAPAQGPAASAGGVAVPGATYPLNNGGAPGPAGVARLPPPAVPPAPLKIRTIDEDSQDGPPATTDVSTKKTVDAATAKAQAAEDKAYIPSGSILSGVLITGLDAATGRSSTQDPIPVLIRLKHEAILPNRFRADYRECFMIAAGYGDLSSERAYLRAETISCVRNDGKVIDTKIEAYAVGEDGKAGVHGHLVSKQGQAIAKAAVAGFAQAYAQALRPNNSATLLGGAAFSGGGVEDGAYGGAASALDRVAKFYIDMANQMFPVIEVDAGRPVSFVAVKGVSLGLVR